MPAVRAASLRGAGTDVCCCRPGDAILGLACLATLAGLRAMKSRLPPAARTEPLATRASYLIVWTCATGALASVPCLPLAASPAASASSGAGQGQLKAAGAQA